MPFGNDYLKRIHLERMPRYPNLRLLSKREECLSSYAIFDSQAFCNHIPNFENMKTDKKIFADIKKVSNKDTDKVRVINNLKLILKRIFGLILLSFLFSITHAQKTWDGSVNNRWDNGNNWSGNTVPGVGDDVIIPLNITITRVPNITLNSLTISNNVSFLANGTARTITINNTNSTSALTVGSGNTLTLGDGSAGNAVHISFQNINTSTSIQGTFASTANVNVILGANQIFTIAGTFVNGGIFNANNSGSTVIYNSNNPQNIVIADYFNLQFFGSGNKTTLGGTINVAGELNTTGGATLLNTNNTSVNISGNISGTGAITSGTGTISVAGDFTNSGTFTSGTGTVTYNGSDQQLKGATYNNLIIAGGGTKTLQASASVGGTLTITSGVLQIGNSNLTLNSASAIGGAPFSSTKMIATDGAGYVLKTASAGATLYPVGSGGFYSPFSSSITAGGATGTVNVRAVSTASLGTGFIAKYWDILTSLAGKTITATYTYDTSEGSAASSAWFKGAGAWQTPPPSGIVSLGATSATVTGTTSITNSSTLWSVGVPNTYYSYKSGSWTDPTIWTSDPGGTTQVGTTIPGNNDFVVILSGRTVTLPSNIASSNLDITINDGGSLDLATFQFSSALVALSGKGTLRIASSYFPNVPVGTNDFVKVGGGTTEFYNGITFNLPAQATYNNLTINKSAATGIQVTDITLNGNLYVKNGKFQINDNIAARRKLTINGDFTVDAGAEINVGTGVTNTTTNPVGIAGVTGGYLNYYENQSHRVIINGNFTNNGVVKFTNLTFPVYNLFPPTTMGATTGFATVYFKGATDNTLKCNGQTDFYNLVLDKGTDQTFKLTVQSSSYQNFRLFGANISGGESPGANPGLKKALWIKTGSLVLKGLVVIPSLTEGGAGGSPVSNYIIPANGALIVDGPDVIVLSTADDYGEVNIAYGVPGTGIINGIDATNTNPQALLVYGKLQVNDGYLSTRESAGLIYDNMSPGQIVLNGGVIDTKQFRENGTTGSGASFSQSTGTFILRGRFIRPVSYSSINDLSDITGAITTRSANGTDGNYGTFNINNSSNIFTMTGGNIRIYDVCGTIAPIYAVNIKSSTSNTNVTGGTIEILSTNSAVGDATPQLIHSASAPFGNLIINRGAGCISDVQLDTYPLTVLNNLSIISGSLLANSLNVTIGGNFNVAGTGLYNSGTNTTAFNGSSDQTFTISGNINNGANGLRNLAINKSSGLLNFTGPQPSLTIQGNLDLTKGTIDDGGKTLFVAGNITNSGTHISTPGTGKIQLNGTAIQTIGGDGNGIFNHLELNNTNAATAPVSLVANTSLNGSLTFLQDKIFNINTYNLKLGASSIIVNGGALRYVQTNGGAGDGGITKIYSSSSSSFSFPIGAPTISPARAVKYTPAILNINGLATTYGSITIVPVGYEHPATKVNSFSLTYFWRVKSSGFILGSATVTHGYYYGQPDMTGINEAECVAARYNPSAYTWSIGTINDVDDINNNIGEPGTGSFLENVSFIDGDYTAGDNVGQNPFAAPTVYYSRANNRWNLNTTWSTDPILKHTGAGAAGTPTLNDVVVIGNGNTVNLTANASCASLQIEAGAVLDIYTWSTVASNFGMVLNHPNGNGLFRLTTTVGSPKLFTFPGGDFSDFNANSGTTEFYDIDGTVGAVYILPANVTSYGNLILTAKGGDNLVLPNNSKTTINGDLTCTGDNPDAWITMSWLTTGVYTPVVEKTVHVTGNMYINNGTFLFLDDQAPQHLIVDGNVTIAPTAVFDVYNNYPVNNGGAARFNSFDIGGSLINNSNANPSARFKTTNNYVNLTFFGANNALITNTLPGATPTTIFNNVTINKGTSQATTLTCNIAGTLITPANNWLTLQNGTFRYTRTNPGTDFTISTTTPFTIPSTSGLYIDYSNARNILIANGNSDANDLYLNGKLTILNGNVYVGTTNGTIVRNNDIEYSGGSSSEIDVQGGALIVNGQIRRNPSTTNGILKYLQSGNSNVVINGQNRAANSNCALLEVFNNGSAFNMSGTSTLTIVRGGGGNTYGDLYLRPETSSVTGGTIIFSQSPAVGPVADVDQNYQMDANIPLSNLIITGKTAATARNASVKLMVNPLVLNGSLTLSNANSFFDVNSAFNIGVTIKGDLVNNGTYSHFNNNTYFTGGVQNISGTSAIDFYNLYVNPVTSLTIDKNALINSNLNLLSGTLSCNNFKVSVKGDVINNATYTDNNGGIVLTGATVQHVITGTGTFGQFELNDALGARIENDITILKNLVMTQGILDINQNLLTLGQNSNITGSSFGNTKMITSDGAFSNIGIKKTFGSPLATTFTFPLGTSGKYTPAVLTITANGSVGSIRVNNINKYHPSAIDPSNVLDYFWEMESIGITGFSGSLVLNYKSSDVVGGPESNYIAARLLLPGTSWSKAFTGFGTDNVDETNHNITFSFPAGTSNLNGEYTAGNDPAIPNNIPEFTSNTDGDWNNSAIWTQTGGDPYTLTGGPNGFVVNVNNIVNVNANNCFSYKTNINSTLRLVSPFTGHNLGTVEGNGKLYLESGELPAGKFDSFFNCSGGGTLEYGGTGSYTMIADRLNIIPKLVFSGSGSRFLPNKDLTICEQLLINGPSVDNSTFNRKLTILGSMSRTSGAFLAGTGNNATVSFRGTSAQVLSDFSGLNSFNNFEINNSAGISLNSAVDINGNLLLTNGLIHTTSTNILRIMNTSVTSVYPSGGSSNSYIAGPLSKRLNQGDTYFRFPVGNNSLQGNKLSLRATQTGTKDWIVEYVNPNILNTYSAPLTAINETEYWNVSAPSGSQAFVNIQWDPASNLTPLMTQFGLTDMRISEYSGTNWTEIPSSATGDNYNGSAESTSKIILAPGGTNSYTLACINTPKPRIKFSPLGAICGNTGIPVTLSTSYALFGPYTVSYSIDGIAQTSLTPASFPFTLPTNATGGVYRLTGFTYNYPAGFSHSGVFDITAVTTFTVPPTANAGPNQSLCGLTSAILAGNSPGTYSGLWSITSGTGGTVATPTINNSNFSGTNGSTYTLRWTISNGGCSSFDDVVVTFPLLAQQPAVFSNSSSAVCAGQNGVVYTVPNDPSVTYSWTYSGSDYTINGTTNSVTIDFGSSATAGTLSVTATNGCGTSAARTMAISMNAPTLITSQSTAAQTQCIGGTFSAISVTATGTGTLTYQWYRNAIASNSGGTLLAGATTAGYVPSAGTAGTTYYYCAVTGTCGSVPSAVSGAFIVNSLPTITITISETSGVASNDGTICNGDAVILTASGGTSYSWSPATGLSATNVSNPTATPTIAASPITYIVTATNGNACINTASQVIVIIPKPSTGDLYRKPNN